MRKQLLGALLLSLASTSFAGWVPSELLVSSAVFAPCVLIIGSPVAVIYLAGKAVGESVTSASNFFKDSPDWQVTAMTKEGEQTRLRLSAPNSNKELEVVVTSKSLEGKNIKVGETLTVHNVGKAAFSLDYAGQPLAVLTTADGGLVHSTPRQ